MKRWLVAFLVLSVPGRLSLATPSLASASGQLLSQSAAVPVAPKEYKVMREFHGIKLDMKAGEVRAAMGKPELEDKDKERYKLGGDDRLTIYYNNGLVKSISLYFTNPKSAPIWTEVVGDTEITENANGSKHARRVMSDDKFWVSMYQSKDGSVTTITISR